VGTGVSLGGDVGGGVTVGTGTGVGSTVGATVGVGVALTVGVGVALRVVLGEVDVTPEVVVPTVGAAEPLLDRSTNSSTMIRIRMKPPALPRMIRLRRP
jgi:hypothetical protein